MQKKENEINKHCKKNNDPKLTKNVIIGTETYIINFHFCKLCTIDKKKVFKSTYITKAFK